MIMISEFLKNFLKGIEISGNFDRGERIKEAIVLMKEEMYEEALEILEDLQHSPSEKSAQCMVIYLSKAVCYTELDYKRSALNCINIILDCDRLSLNPFYQYTLSDIKVKAKEIKEQYKL